MTKLSSEASSSISVKCVFFEFVDLSFLQVFDDVVESAAEVVSEITDSALHLRDRSSDFDADAFVRVCEISDAAFETADSAFDIRDSAFETVDSALDTTDSAFETVDSAFDTADSAFETVDSARETVDPAFETLDFAFDIVDSAFDTVECVFDTVESALETADSALETVDSALETALVFRVLDAIHSLFTVSPSDILEFTSSEICETVNVPNLLIQVSGVFI